MDDWDVTTAIGDLIAVFSIGALGLLLFELGWLWRRGCLRWSRIGEMAASYSTLVLATVVELALLGALVSLYAIIGQVAPWAIETSWLTGLLCVVLADFTYYWEHRISHQVRALWALYHSVHHSAPIFDQSTAYRVSFVDFFFAPLFYLPLVLIGFDPLLVLLSYGFVLAYQTWLHTETIGRLGWLDKVLNTPSNHRVHHAAQNGYLDRNYGGILILWDRLFGTYQPEQDTPVYGLTDPLNSINPLKVHFCEAVRLITDLRRTAGPRAWLRMALGPPAPAVQKNRAMDGRRPTA